MFDMYIEKDLHKLFSANILCIALLENAVSLAS